MSEQFFSAPEYDLASTLSSGQTFRWRLTEAGWVNVVDGKRVCLKTSPGGITAQTVVPVHDWKWLSHYLQLEVDLPGILATFPKDEPMRRAAAACRGLRLLRQEPWECLASFILSSTKQIVQIEQIVEAICRRFGARVPGDAWTFPRPEALAQASEVELRQCKMGFRAPYLRTTAQRIARGELDLESLRALPVAEAREGLLTLPGVGRKIADCVLLFAYGFETAFPVDVWVMKALRALYFPRRRPSARRLLRFSETYFGTHAGYAQQYLFHYARVHAKGSDLFRSKKTRSI